MSLAVGKCPAAAKKGKMYKEHGPLAHIHGGGLSPSVQLLQVATDN